MTTMRSAVLAHPREVAAAPLVADWCWWLGWALLALGLAEVPLLLAACCGPSGWTGLGTFWFVNDFAQYESAMRQGAESASWLVYDRFTPEPHAPALMFTAYVALGKLAALLGLPALALYRPAELAARGALLLGARQLVLALVPGRAEQRLAAALLLFGMGLGVPAALVGALLGISPYTGNGSYEVNSFGLLFSAPHVALAMGLTLSAAAILARGRAWGATLTFLTLAGFALALLHPFHLPALLAGFALSTLLRWRRERTDTAPALLLLSFALGAAPVLLYDTLTFGADPFWTATYNAQNLLPSPQPWQLLIEYGVLLLLAVPGALVAVRRGVPWRALLCWLAVALLASYAPVPFQRRLGFGLQPLLALLAAAGLPVVLARLRPGPARLVRGGVLVLAFLTTASVAAGIVASALWQEPLRPYRVDSDSAQAVEFLARQACAADVVLADWDLSNYLAGQFAGRVVAGHPVATVDAVARKVALEQAGTDPARWQALVDQFQPSYVLYGPRQAGLPAPAGGARAIFRAGSAVVYALGSSRCE